MAVAVLFVSCGALWAASTPCIRADMFRPFILPDGSYHQSGTLRLCLDREYSPVAGLHRTLVDGDPIGMFISKSVLSEGVEPGQQPVVIFRRMHGGRLALLGYAVPVHGRTRIYWMSTERQPLGLATLTGAPLEDIEIVIAGL
jgi:hypothetical protein